MMKNLKLERPIAFIDVETRGTHPHSDRIVELLVQHQHSTAKLWARQQNQAPILK